MRLFLSVFFAIGLLGAVWLAFPGEASADGFVQTFDIETTDAAPSDWSINAASGSVKVNETPSASDKSMKLEDVSSGVKVEAVRTLSGSSTAEATTRFRAMALQTDAVFGFFLRKSSSNVVTVAFDSNGYLYTYDGNTKTNLQTYTGGAWYSFEIQTQIAAGTFDLYINGLKVADDYAFRQTVTGIDNIYIGSGTATTGVAYFDEIGISYLPSGAPYTYLGAVTPKASSEITASNWSVGGETQDRDYAVYDSYKDYLGPLGVKKVRMQGGWAKTEKTAGVYDWSWLDDAVNDAISQGVEPWLETSYGNPIYPGGGGTTLGGVLPTSETALTAWDNWVKAIVNRYKDLVHEWEVWNEPDAHISATDYADFFVRTADDIRSIDPSAKILALALAGIGNTTYVDTFLDRVQQLGKLSTIDEITIHGYPTNPDSSYGSYANLRNVIANYSGTIKLRQGESGAPSTYGTAGALSGWTATELKQTKWDLRRMLRDLGVDAESSAFTIMDFYIPGTGWNTKGLIQSYGDKTAAYAKPAYFAIQNLTSIFDDSLQRIAGYSYSRSGSSAAIQVFGYEHAASSQQIVAIWKSGAAPSDDNTATAMNFTFNNGHFTDPVYVNLLDGKVYDIPSANWSQSGSAYTFTDVPVPDAPILIADKSLVDTTSAAPGAFSLTSPGNGTNNIASLPEFSWTASANAGSYRLTVARDAQFSDLILDRPGIVPTSNRPVLDLTSSATYYWRVTAENGNGKNTSSSFSFTTSGTYNELVSDDFNADTTDAAPSGWTVSGTGGAIAVKEVPSSADKSMRIADTSASADIDASRSFAPQFHTLAVEFDARADQTNQLIRLGYLQSGTTQVVSVYFRPDGTIRYYDGSAITTLQTYSANTWYHFKLLADPFTGKFDIYIDNMTTPAVSQADFRAPVSSIDSIHFGTNEANTGKGYIDNVNVYKP